MRPCRAADARRRDRRHRRGATHGPGVINLSLGGFDQLHRGARDLLRLRRGPLIVAAAGNTGERAARVVPRELPARAHRRRHRRVRPRDVVLERFAGDRPLAPGHDITVAVPRSSIRRLRLGGRHELLRADRLRSAAAVWTLRPTLNNTQIFDLMRCSARDVGKPGFDPDTGFGILDIPARADAQAAARRPAGAERRRPPRQAERPARAGTAPLTSRIGRAPRFGLPRRARIRRTSTASGFRPRARSSSRCRPNPNVDLELWGPRTHDRRRGRQAARRDLSALGTHGRDGRARDVKGRGAGVLLRGRVPADERRPQASYLLSVAPAATLAAAYSTVGPDRPRACARARSRARPGSARPSRPPPRPRATRAAGTRRASDSSRTQVATSR